MKVRSKLFRVSAVLLLLAFLGGCASELPQSAETTPSVSPQPEAQYVEKETPEGIHLRDDPSLYEGVNGSSVITMYLTVTSGNSADGSDHTWAEINTYSAYDYEDWGVDRYQVEGLLQIDETGQGLSEDSFGYGETVPNVSVQIRGQTSTNSSVKSYKVRIKEGKGTYRDQRTLNLNKHTNDPFRFLNKLSYDLLNTIPQLIGGRTQFVHLYVKDLTEGGDGEYRDYGLYTMVEQVNRRFLKNHGLDENGQLYKVTFFEWNQYPEILIPQDDPDYDEAAFETYMEIKGNGDHSKLRDVLEDIGNYAKPIQAIVEEHFDAENLCYWMAFNILLGNYDSGARNLFLYSPLNSQKFYCICWDLDVSFKYSFHQLQDYSEGGSWEQGMTQYLGLTLVNRMMREQEYRDMLTAAVEDLYTNYINPETVRRLVVRYSKVAKPFLFSGADSKNTRLKEDVYDELIGMIPLEAEFQYQTYQETLLRPWPFFIDLPHTDAENGRMEFTWGTSYEVRGEAVTYDCILARDCHFEDVIAGREGLSVPYFSTEMLPPGKYFLKVTARNASGYMSDCFDYYFDDSDDEGKHYGCYCFIVTEDGTVKYYLEEG